MLLPVMGDHLVKVHTVTSRHVKWGAVLKYPVTWSALRLVGGWVQSKWSYTRSLKGETRETNIQKVRFCQKGLWGQCSGKIQQCLGGRQGSFNLYLLRVNNLVVSVGRRGIREKMSVMTCLFDQSCVALIFGMPFLTLVRNLCQPLFQVCLLAVLAGAGDGVEAHPHGDRSHDDEKGRLDQLVSIIVPRVLSLFPPAL